MEPELLEQLGLTEGEAKVYLALLKLGETTTGPLSKQADVSYSKVYKILEKLEKKGLAGHITKAKARYFSAVSPERIFEFLDQKENELKKKREVLNKLVPQLKLEQQMAKTPEAVVYNGFKAVTNFLRSMLDELGSGDEYLVVGAGYGETPALRPFFTQFHSQRAQKNIHVKMLANYDQKDRLVETALENGEIRYLPQYLITKMQIILYKEKAFIVFWTKSPTGFLMEGEEIVESFKAYFNAFWENAENADAGEVRTKNKK